MMISFLIIGGALLIAADISYGMRDRPLQCRAPTIRKNIRTVRRKSVSQVQRDRSRLEYLYQNSPTEKK